MNRRSLLAVTAVSLATGCLGGQATGERNSPRRETDSPTPTDRGTTNTTTTAAGTWGYLSVGNVSPDPVEVTLTVEDVEGSGDGVRTYTDTVKLGPDGHEDHDHDHEKKSKTYRDIPVNRAAHMHEVTVGVADGPRGSKRFRPANMDSDLSVSISRDAVEFQSVVGGPTGPSPTATTEG